MKTFGKIKNWLVNHMPTRRRLIQFYTFLLYNANSKGYIQGNFYTGKTKYMCVPGMNCYSCPGAIGACPLGSLQNALNASYNSTAYYVFGILGLFGLIFARTICGFLCPVGLGQELLYKIKTPKLGKSRYTRILSYLKHLLLVVLVIAIPVVYAYSQTAMPGFCKYICPAGTFEGGIGLLLNPNNWPGGANDNMLAQLGPIFTWKFCVLVVVIVASVFMYRPFCRFLCPLGAIYGFFNRIALIGVKLDNNKCTDCGLCIQHCKMDIKHVGDHECINCGECISVCPAKAISWKGSKIFLRKNDIDEPAVTEERPLADIKSIRFASPTPVAETATLTPAFETAGAGNITKAHIVYNQAEAPTNTAKGGSGSLPTKPSAKPKKQRGRSFWIEFAAWTLAIVFLGGLFIYYNVIDKGTVIKKQNEGTEIGNVLYDFDATLYDEGSSSFTLKKSLGKTSTLLVLFDDSEESKTQIINVNNAYNEFALTYSDFSKGTKLIAIHSASMESAADFISSLDDTDFIFGKDSDTSNKDGDTSNKDSDTSGIFSRFEEIKLPLTVMLDKEGVILYKSDKVVDSNDMAKDIHSSYTGYKEGMLLPEFSIPTYGKNAKGNYLLLTDVTFNPADHMGEVMVINFWGTWCTPCVAEIPHFNEVAKEFPDVNVVAIHGHKEDGIQPERFIRNHKDGWIDYSLLFAQGDLNADGTLCTTYQLLGGTGTYPMTLIVGKNGVVLFRQVGSITYEALKEEVEKALNA